MHSRRRNLAFSIGILAAFLLPLCAAEKKHSPRHDPAEQLFRRAPMAESARSIVVNLETNLHAAFDADSCRVHTIWKGGPLNLWGPPYSNTKSPFICDFQGERVYTFPQVPVWSTASQPMTVNFQGMGVTNGSVQFEYAAGVSGEPLRVRESMEGVVEGEVWAVRRTLDLAITQEIEEDLSYLVFAEGGAKVEGKKPLRITGTNGVLYLTVEATGGDVSVQAPDVEYTEEIITEVGTEKGNPKVERRGRETRVYVQFPKMNKGKGTITIVMSNSPREIAFAKKEKQTQVVYERGEETQRESGDEFYRVEHFPIPKAAEFMVTGMDWLNDRDLAVCTWLGEIYIVENATGPVDGATYRRFARGLNEPLGLTVVDGEIYVVQKGELTRVVDTNRDGEADLFACVNDDWGYSGNYHSYSFGPLVTGANEFMVFVTGQRGRADLLYQGFALSVSESGAKPFCHGLRVPHGWGTHQGDIFVTDNQGNWIGTCRLNHIEAGKFYGFPSSKPATQRSHRADEVAPPALWLPRALSPSASGIETIDTDAFGPFKGQMLIGDFQNSIVMRAFLEKVNGKWQGAVFPFAKGFLSGVNRMAMGADGKLYVGGGKRTWSTAAPKEYSLDRVSFTGRVPFEVSEVRALQDGFELRFTKPLEIEPARDPKSYLVKQFTYKYHADYGSPEFDHEGKAGATETLVEKVEVSNDGKSVRLRIPGLKSGFVTSFQLAVNSAEDEDLRHDSFYYTLNEQPR